MGDLSRRSSRRPLLLESESTNSLTTFPDPPPSRSSPAPANNPSMAAESLYGLLDREESTIFDERPSVDIDDPRALSATKHAVLEGVIDHHGATNLVKRLSEALAQRDAHITALQRLCEEYKIPQDRIADTADRVKQAERRRLSLSAASEDLVPSADTSSKASVSFYDLLTYCVCSLIQKIRLWSSFQSKQTMEVQSEALPGSSVVRPNAVSLVNGRSSAN